MSGEIPQEPVVARTTGILFEKRLITAHLASNSTCPVTNTPLTLEDLIPIQASSKILKQTIMQPKLPNLTSMPALLMAFQNEWDQVVLEQFQLRKKYLETREELTKALYQQDAAARVIARLIKERDEARDALSALEAVVHQGSVVTHVAENGDVPMDVETVQPTHDLFNQVVAKTLDELQSSRKQMLKSRPFPTYESVQGYTKIKELSSLHSAAHPGILCIDPKPLANNAISLDDVSIATGGVDKQIHIVSLANGKILGSGKGHTKKVNDIAWINDSILASASADHTVRIWKEHGKTWKAEHNIKEHSAEVVSVCVHPSKKYILSADRRASWNVIDVEQGEVSASKDDDETGVSYYYARLHPDGALFGCAGVKNESTGCVRLWDLRSQQVAATFTDGIQGAVNTLSFSENGYHLATADSNQVQMWDLRKLACIHTIATSEGMVKSMAFDPTGMFLTMAGVDVKTVWVGKKGDERQWSVVNTYEDAVAEVTSTAVLPNGHIVSASLDRCVRVYGAS